MPSIVRSYKWFVRVDGSAESLKEKCKSFSGQIDAVRMLSLFHMGETKENPHCHFVIELSSEIQKQSFDVRLKKTFDIEKRSQFSSKVWDGHESACGYMFHESPHNIICNKGFTSEEISRFIKINEDTQKVVDINKSRAPGRQVDRIVTEFNGEEPPTRYAIFKVVMQKIRDGEMYEPGDFQLPKIVEEIYGKTRDARGWVDYVEDRYRKLFRDY